MPDDRCPSSRSACSASLSASGPACQAKAACVPTSTIAVSRACGNTEMPRDDPGRPNSSRLRASSGCRFKDEPSKATRRSPQYHAPGVPGCASGATQLSRSAENGTAPRRARALEIEDLPDTRTGKSGEIHRRLSTRQRRTSRAETVRNTAIAIT